MNAWHKHGLTEFSAYDLRFFEQCVYPKYADQEYKCVHDKYSKLPVIFAVNSDAVKFSVLSSTGYVQSVAHGSPGTLLLGAPIVFCMYDPVACGLSHQLESSLY